MNKNLGTPCDCECHQDHNILHIEACCYGECKICKINYTYLYKGVCKDCIKLEEPCYTR